MVTIKLLSIARDRTEHERGLMHVKHLPEDTGMCFDFGKSRVLNFWMANTPLPLDIAFISDEGRIIKTESMVPFSLKSVSSDVPCCMAIEAPEGTFARLGISEGSIVNVDPFLMRASFEEEYK